MTIRIDGIEGVLADLSGVTERLRDLTPAMEVAAAATVAVTDESFESQSSPSGNEWADHSPVTVELRERKRGRRRRRAADSAPSMRKLIDTSRLRQSINAESSKTGFRFGSDVVYAAAQHFGNPENRMFGGKRAPIPARPFFPVVGRDSGLELMTGARADEHWEYVRDLVKKYIETGEL